MGLFTTNRKTVLSVDFNRDNTCKQICSYCYVAQTEKQYPAYKAKILGNHTLAENDPAEFAAGLKKEYKKAIKSKSKAMEGLKSLPVRIYGSGDFIPEHMDFLKELDFKFFIISKNLTMPDMVKHIDDLLKLPNLTSLVLSFDSANIANYSTLKKLFLDPRITTSFTGDSEELETAKDKREFGIFFNTDRKKSGLAKSSKFKESCPCDSGKIPSLKACTVCSKCWKPKKEYKTRLLNL